MHQPVVIPNIEGVGLTDREIEHLGGLTQGSDAGDNAYSAIRLLETVTLPRTSFSRASSVLRNPSDRNPHQPSRPCAALRASSAPRTCTVWFRSRRS